MDVTKRKNTPHMNIKIETWPNMNWDTWINTSAQIPEKCIKVKGNQPKNCLRDEDRSSDEKMDHTARDRIELKHWQRGEKLKSCKRNGFWALQPGIEEQKKETIKLTGVSIELGESARAEFRYKKKTQSSLCACAINPSQREREREFRYKKPQSRLCACTIR
jgi:hypothetical protein